MSDCVYPYVPTPEQAKEMTTGQWVDFDYSWADAQDAYIECCRDDECRDYY